MGWMDKFKKPADGAADQSEAEMNALVERLGSSLEERIAKPLSERIDKLQGEWEAVKTEATKPPEVDRRPKDENGNHREFTEEEKIRLGLQTNFAMNVQTNARLTEAEVIDEIRSSWPDQVAEIRGFFANAPIEVKGRADYPEYCRNIVDMVIGRAAKKAGLRYSEQSKGFFLEDKSGATSDGENPLSDPALSWRKPDGTVVTAVQTLEKLGIDPKKFVERQKEAN